MSDTEVKTLSAALISYRQAQAAIEAAIAFARGKSVKLSFVVLDSAGHLVAAARMDGAAFVTIEVARGKAFACAASGGQPGTALAQDALSNPSAAQYGPQSQVQGTNTTGSAAANTSSPSTKSGTGTLPFTGLDALVLGVVAVALIGTGMALRRLSTPKPRS